MWRVAGRNNLLATAVRAAGLAALLTVLLAAVPAQAERRVALVIGNDRYAHLPPDRQLAKAVNDAEAMGAGFARLGFEVIVGRNLGRQGMIDKLAELTGKLSPGDTAAFFYAGHGVAIGGVNYLVPSDVPAVTPDAEARVRGAAIAEGDIVAELQARGVRVALLVLDACRDNPFPHSGTRAIGSTRGLADAKPARGVFTVYSAGIGQTALDALAPNDPARNSVFTRIFVEELTRPGLDLGGLAIEVREKVAKLALEARDDSGQPAPHEQTPAYYDQTVGGRIFLAGRGIAVEPKPVADLPPPAAAPAPAVDEITWNFLKQSSDLASLRRFVVEFPDSRRKAEAQARIAALEREAGLPRQEPQISVQPARARPDVALPTSAKDCDPARAAQVLERGLAPGETVLVDQDVLLGEERVMVALKPQPPGSGADIALEVGGRKVALDFCRVFTARELERPVRFHNAGERVIELLVAFDHVHELGSQSQSPPPPPPTSTPPRPERTAVAPEAIPALWDRVSGSLDVAALEAFVDSYRVATQGDLTAEIRLSDYAAQARRRIEVLRHLETSWPGWRDLPEDLKRKLAEAESRDRAPKGAAVAPAQQEAVTTPGSGTQATAADIYRYLNLFGEFHEELARQSPDHAGDLVAQAVAAMLAAYPSATTQAMARSKLTAVGRDKSKVYARLNVFGDVFEALRKAYPGAESTRRMTETAIAGMLDTVPASAKAEALRRLKQTNRTFDTVSSGGKVRLVVK